MKLNKMVLANAFGLSTAILWTLCTAIVWFLPDFSWQVTGWWMHGMDLTAMGNWMIDLNNFFLGGITLTVSAWVSGWIFGWSWEMMSKK